MGGFCDCQFSTRPDGPGLICNEPAKHRGPHQAHGVTWPQLFEPTRGGDYDPRDQVGVEDTGPAAAPVLLQATDPDAVYTSKHARMLRYLVEWPHSTDGDEEIDAYEAGADALEELQATRDRLADLERLREVERRTLRWILARADHSRGCTQRRQDALESLVEVIDWDANAPSRAALDGPAAQEEGG